MAVDSNIHILVLFVVGFERRHRARRSASTAPREPQERLLPAEREEADDRALRRSGNPRAGVGKTLTHHTTLQC